MVTVEYRVLQVGVGQLNVIRLARCVFGSNGARDCFGQRTDFTVEALLSRSTSVVFLLPA